MKNWLTFYVGDMMEIWWTENKNIPDSKGTHGKILVNEKMITYCLENEKYVKDKQGEEGIEMTNILKKQCKKVHNDGHKRQIMEIDWLAGEMGRQGIGMIVQ